MARPWRSAFLATRALPAGVVGPVLARALRRLAQVRAEASFGGVLLRRGEFGELGVLDRRGRLAQTLR